MTHHDIPAASGSSVPNRAARECVLLAERLADPALLEQAVEIQLGPEDDGSTDACLAVPVVGRRVAGQVTVMGWGQATQVMLALTGRPGFPDVRDFGFGVGIDEPRAIRWGLHIPSAEHRECAQMWGYHAAGVETYVAERESESIPVTPLPDLPTAPTVARLYDALLGGHDNYAEDRGIFTGFAWEEAEALATTAVINRLHPPAIVRYRAGRGITQYLDLGCGFPVTDATPHPLTYRYPTLHDLVAKEGVEDPRVVYVDHDIRIYRTAGIELEADPQPEWVLGDIRYMGQLLSSGRMRRLLNWDRPIAVLLHDVLPWIPDDGEVTVSLAVLREQLPPESVLSITHAADSDENQAAPRCRAGLHAPESPCDRRPVRQLASGVTRARAAPSLAPGAPVRRTPLPRRGGARRGGRQTGNRPWLTKNAFGWRPASSPHLRCGPAPSSGWLSNTTAARRSALSGRTSDGPTASSAATC